MERKDIVLNNGVTMPPIGYGVFRMTNVKVLLCRQLKQVTA